MVAPWYAQASFLRKLTATCSFATAWYCVFHVEYDNGKEHCFSWIQGYYRKEVVAPVSNAADWASKKIKALREP